MAHHAELFPKSVGERTRPYMGAIRLAEERGSCRCVGHFLEHASWAVIRDLLDEAVPEQMAAVRLRHRANLAYEAVHGRGSLLKRDHWYNAKYAALID